MFRVLDQASSDQVAVGRRLVSWSLLELLSSSSWRSPRSRGRRPLLSIREVERAQLLYLLLTVLGDTGTVHLLPVAKRFLIGGLYASC